MLETVPRPGISADLQDYLYCSNQKSKNAWKENGVTFIDTWNTLSNYGLFNRDAIHLNDRGCYELVKILNDVIIKPES